MGRVKDEYIVHLEHMGDPVDCPCAFCDPNWRRPGTYPVPAIRYELEYTDSDVTWPWLVLWDVETGRCLEIWPKD